MEETIQDENESLHSFFSKGKSFKTVILTTVETMATATDAKRKVGEPVENIQEQPEDSAPSEALSEIEDYEYEDLDGKDSITTIELYRNELNDSWYAVEVKEQA